MADTALPTRPEMDLDDGALYDRWLLPNGIVGWMPAGSTIAVKDGKITWPRWRHLDPTSGPWERNVELAYDKQRDLFGTPEGDAPVVDHVTVPMVVPLDDAIRDLFALCDLTLVEE